MGVAGVAWATFIAQGVASVVSAIVLFKRVRNIKTDEQSEIFSVQMLGRICRVAIPSILQQSFVSVGNLFVQAIINEYGSSVVAGYSSAIKLNTFAITSFSALSNAMSSFTAQNISTNQIKRIKSGFKTALVMLVCVALPFIVLYCGFGETMLKLFMDDTSELAIATGKEFLLIASPFYIIIAAKLVADGVTRGAGKMRLFMISTFTDLILRVILAYVFQFSLGTTGIWLSWPIGWVVAAILSCTFYFKGLWIPKTEEMP